MSTAVSSNPLSRSWSWSAKKADDIPALSRSWSWSSKQATQTPKTDDLSNRLVRVTSVSPERRPCSPVALRRSSRLQSPARCASPNRGSPMAMRRSISPVVVCRSSRHISRTDTSPQTTLRKSRPVVSPMRQRSSVTVCVSPSPPPSVRMAVSRSPSPSSRRPTSVQRFRSAPTPQPVCSVWAISSEAVNEALKLARKGGSKALSKECVCGVRMPPRFSPVLRRSGRGKVEVDMTYHGEEDEVSSTTASTGVPDEASCLASPDLSSRHQRSDFEACSIARTDSRSEISEDDISPVSSAVSSALLTSRRLELEKLISSMPSSARANEEDEESHLHFAGLGAKLQQALFEAFEVGLTREDEIVAQAVRIVSSWEDARKSIRAQLSQCIDDFHNCGSRKADVASLRTTKKRLSTTLLNARDLNLAESEFKDVEVYRRKTHNRIEDIKGQVRVYCRIRPISQTEKRNKDRIITRAVDDMTAAVGDKETYHFDCVFEPGTQAEVFDDCNDLVQSAFDGFNVTMLMYGQTGAGKTYTMLGNRSNEGIAGHSISEIFRLARESSSWQETHVRASVVELYNNHLTDLAAGHSGESLSVHGAGDINGLKEIPVDSERELKDLLSSCFERRAVASHVLNSESSRSHLIFTIHVASVNHETKQQMSGKIILCDLAGSERLKKTEASGSRRKEAIEINKSLAALGDVIEAVAKKHKQIPYRNHKLTQILQDSIGGAAKTLMMVNCSPTLSNASETSMALKFASRAKKITNAPDSSRQSPA